MIAGQSIFPWVITLFKILITITLDYIILIGHHWEKQGWFAPINLLQNLCNIYLSECYALSVHQGLLLSAVDIYHDSTSSSFLLH